MPPNDPKGHMATGEQRRSDESRQNYKKVISTSATCFKYFKKNNWVLIFNEHYFTYALKMQHVF